ncbi:MAG: class I SAM-dependent methyltransferase [Myxococcota bacterium]
MYSALDAALDRRRADLARWEAEATTCYRLLHGAVEGAPGLTVDRYGPILLVQTWREPLPDGALPELAARCGSAVGAALLPVWNHRAPPIDFEAHHPIVAPADPVGTELGVRYDVRPRHRGQDPLLFLDLRVVRRRVLATSAGRSVVNLFAYTGGVGVCAAVGGATEVWNVDFAASALEVAEGNARRNGVGVRVIREDALAVLRQLAGVKVGRHRPTVRLEARAFDRVVLDPPRWSKGRYGAVDVVNDYPSLFKPAVLATRPGGEVVATNHVPSVELDGWLEGLERCARKAGRPLRSVEVLTPEADFPSPDGRSPLKIAWCTVE